MENGICGSNRTCKEIVLQLVKQSRFNKDKKAFELPSIPKFLASFAESDTMKKHYTAFCNDSLKGRLGKSCEKTLKQFVMVIGSNDSLNDSFRSFIWSLLTNSDHLDGEFVRVMAAMHENKSENISTADQVPFFVQEYKPFMRYCLKKPDNCYSSYEAYDACEDSSFVDRMICNKTKKKLTSECWSTYESEIGRCRARYAGGILMKMLDDIPNHTVFDKDTENYAFNSQTYLAIHIEDIQSISTWQDFSLYLGIAKTISTFSKDIDRCEEEPI